MRILSTVTRNYYGHYNAIEPMYLAFTLPLRHLGHQVDHFDHVQISSEAGPAECGEKFVRAVRAGGYDLILYQTGGRDFMPHDAIRHANKYVPVVAFNSDDDWQWESYSRYLAPSFTYMMTTYPHVYQAHRAQFPNLLLSQWGALDTYSDYGRSKDLDFTFAGQVYRNRVAELRTLRRQAGLRVHGMGSLRVWCPPLNHRGFRDRAAKLFPAINRPMELRQVYDIWNRSKISYTPMSSSVDPSLLQIKGRAFEMGLSGTLMLCQNSPNLARYYEPGKEFVPFETLEDCMEKARWYLTHESARREIVEAYHDRTKAEHMWEDRWAALFDEMGMRKQAAA